MEKSSRYLVLENGSFFMFFRHLRENLANGCIHVAFVMVTSKANLKSIKSKVQKIALGNHFERKLYTCLVQKKKRASFIVTY